MKFISYLASSRAVCTQVSSSVTYTIKPLSTYLQTCLNFSLYSRIAGSVGTQYHYTKTKVPKRVLLKAPFHYKIPKHKLTLKHRRVCWMVSYRLLSSNFLLYDSFRSLLTYVSRVLYLDTCVLGYFSPVKTQKVYFIYPINPIVFCL